jgi:hypothetical protein
VAEPGGSDVVVKLLAGDLEGNTVDPLQLDDSAPWDLAYAYGYLPMDVDKDKKSPFKWVPGQQDRFLPRIYVGGDARHRINRPDDPGGWARYDAITPLGDPRKTIEYGKRFYGRGSAVVLGRTGPDQTFMMNAMAHELAHILTDKETNDGHYAERQPPDRRLGPCNLMWRKGRMDGGVDSGKRLWFQPDGSTPPFDQMQAIQNLPYLFFRKR